MILIFFVSVMNALSAQSAHLYLQTEPFSLDPRIGVDRRSQTVLRTLFEGLTRINKQGNVELALARSVDISEDQLTLRFTLHDARWSNKKKITASDFVRSWKSCIDPAFGSTAAHHFFDIKNAKKAYEQKCSLDDVAVSAIDDTHLKVTLERPIPYFLELLSLPVFSPLSPSVDTKNFISNGAYLLEDHSSHSHILLKKNPEYRCKDEIHLDHIKFSIIEESCTAFSLFQKKELDWYGDPCGIIPIEYITILRNKLSCEHVGALYWLRCSSKRLSLKTRQKIASAINRDQVCRLLNGGEKPAYSILPEKLSQYSASFLPINAKLPEKITLTHWAEPASTAIAELLQQQLQDKLHITIELNALDWTSYLNALNNNDFEIITAACYQIVNHPFPSLEYLSTTDWVNKDFSAIMANSQTPQNPELLKEAEMITLQELPIIPLHYLAFKYMKAKGLQGEVLSPVGVMELKWLEWEKKSCL